MSLKNIADEIAVSEEDDYGDEGYDDYDDTYDDQSDNETSFSKKVFFWKLSQATWVQRSVGGLRIEPGGTVGPICGIFWNTFEAAELQIREGWGIVAILIICGHPNYGGRWKLIGGDGKTWISELWLVDKDTSLSNISGESLTNSLELN